MCVEIVMMILMMISAKEKRYTTCVGAHKVTKRYAKKKISLPCALSHTKPPAISKKWRRPKKKRVKKKREKKERQHSPSSTFGLKAWDSKTKSEKKMPSSFFLLPIINSSSSSFRRKTLNKRKTRKTNALSRCRLARRTTTTRRVSYRRSSEDASVRRL